MCFKSLIAALVLGMTSVMALGQTTLKKTMLDSYSLGSTGKLAVRNSYGDIRMIGWEKDEVSMSMEVSVTERERDRAKDLLDRVQLQVDQQSGYLELASRLLEREVGFFAKYLGIGKEPVAGRGNLRIDITVYVPNAITVQVSNRFGDVVVDDWSGGLGVTVEHGDVWVNGDLVNADFAVRYGKVKAQGLDRAKVTLENGSLFIDRVKELQLNSMGSTIHLGEVGYLDLVSNKDNLYFERIDQVDGKLEFSSIGIGLLGSRMDLGMRISDMELYGMQERNAQLRLAEESSEIIIHVKDFGGSFEAIIEEGVVRIPKSFRQVQSVLLDKSRARRKISSISGVNGKGKIRVSGQKGVVVLQDK